MSTESISVEEQTATAIPADFQRDDYSMVTFTLGERDYAINIMHTNKIIKSNKFTYVPNVAYYVRGVINLRGDIIPVVDLRLFFNLQITANEENAAGEENIIILDLNGIMVGVIVDKINHVVSISSHNIQRSHPLFSDINVRYIDGVVEEAGKLYIILDVERIVQVNSDDEDENNNNSVANVNFSAPPPQPAAVEAKSEPVETAAPPAPTVVDKSGMDAKFIAEALPSLINFHVSHINDFWFKHRLEQWKRDCADQSRDFQLQNGDDAANFLRPFYSRYSEMLWGQDLIDEMRALLPNNDSGNYHVWNPGCGNGIESYSIACLIKSHLPNLNLKIRAGDNDLVKITNAPQMSLPGNVSEFYAKFLGDEGKNGVQFDTIIKDCITFEYQDVTNAAPYHGLDMIFVRDLLSFFPNDTQNVFLQTAYESLNPSGLLILGDNESVPANLWQRCGNGKISAFKKL